MLLKNLVKGLDIIETRGDLNVNVKGIAYDSRKAKAGIVFVCIEGRTVDGHDYIPNALENGANMLIVQRHVEVPDDVTVIRVKDARYALAYVSDMFFDHPSAKFKLVGITGTKGKTTTTYMIKSILEYYGQKVGLIGTIANFIGKEELHTERTTPESYDLQALFAEMVEKQVDTVVMEVSSQGLELHRVSCCDYDIGVFTNLTRAHIGGKEHSSFEDYLNAKAKLFTMCKKGLINIDSKYAQDIRKQADCELITYGIENKADIKADNVVKNPGSVEFEAVTPWGKERFFVDIPGQFNVYNALAATGVCGLLGIPFKNIKEGLANIKVPGRLEPVETGKDFTVLIDYAYTPDSLENVLKTLREYAPGRLVCMFGCGGDRDRGMRPMMGKIAGAIADFTIITSDNPRTEEPAAIISDIEAGIRETDGKYVTILERREAIRYAIENAQPKDIIILAGKGHETYQIFKDKTIHFDEREVVKEILDELGIK